MSSLSMLSSKTKTEKWFFAWYSWAFPIALSFLLIPTGCKKPKPPFQGAALSNIQGTVHLSHAGQKPILLKAGSLSLAAKGDAISTAAKSSVDLQFPAGISMRLGENSSLVLTEALFGAKGEPSNVKADLSKGKLMARTEKLSANSNFTVKTPTLVASVRGTDFLVKPDEKEVLVENGSVEVQPPGEGQEPKIVEGGNKAETKNEEVEVQPLTEEDKKELSDMQEGLEFINNETRARMEEIRDSFEQERNRIHEKFQEQLDKNRKTMDAEKERQEAEFASQKDRITGAKKKTKQDEAKSALDRIKSGGQ